MATKKRKKAKDRNRWRWRWRALFYRPVRAPKAARRRSPSWLKPGRR